MDSLIHYPLLLAKTTNSAYNAAMIDLLWKLDGYLLIPHELMHVVAYRMIGKRCAYQFGDHSVKALEDRTLNERLFCLLLPLLVNGLGVLMLAGVWMGIYVIARYPIDPFAYFETSPWWHQSMFFGWVFLLSYAATCFWDVQLAARLIAEKLAQQPPQHSHEHQDNRHRPQKSQWH
jgi:hypothetical protein